MIIRLRYFVLQGIVNIVGVTGFDREIKRIGYPFVLLMRSNTQYRKYTLDYTKMRKIYEKINYKNP